MLAVDPGTASIIVGSISAVGAITAAMVAANGARNAREAKSEAEQAHTHAREANEAVNQRHKLGVDDNGDPLHPRLYDAVIDSMLTVKDVQEKVSEVDKRQKQTDQKVSNLRGHVFELTRHVTGLDGALREHVGWEEGEKWTTLEEHFEAIKTTLTHTPSNTTTTPQEEPAS